MKLLPHQKSGIAYILSHSNAFVCDDMGMGKTRTVIEALFKRGAFPILVLCPASLKLNWQTEIKKWVGYDTPVDDINADVVIMNYERMQKHRYDFPDRGFKQIVIDESHNFKNSKSIRTQIAIEIAKNIPYRILISGSPMLNRPAELVTQLAILNQLSKFGGEQRFLNTFCGAKQTPWGRSYVGASQLTTLRNKMRNIWLRRTKADLKSSLPQKHIIELPITSHKQPSPHSLREVEKYDNAVLNKKIPLAIDFIGQLLARGEKTVVFVHHKRVVEAIQKKFPAASVIVGGQSAKARQKNVDSFQHGETPLIICSLQASAVGLTLTSARCAVFVEYPWSPSLLNQAQDRIHRLSQTQDCFIYYLYAKNSIDEYRLNTNQYKEIIINHVV